MEATRNFFKKIREKDSVKPKSELDSKEVSDDVRGSHKVKRKSKVKEELPDEEAYQHSGNGLNQLVVTHEGLQKFLWPQLGREYCSDCNDFKEGSLRWNIAPFLSSEPLEPLSEIDSKRLVAYCMGSMNNNLAMLLYDEATTGGKLAFNSNPNMSMVRDDLSNFLNILVSNHLEKIFPAIFDDASCLLIGSWAHETALECDHPVFDYIVNLPAWVKSNKLCTCFVDSINSENHLNFKQKKRTAQGEELEYMPFVTNLHKSAIVSVERVFSQMALEVFMNTDEMTDLRLAVDSSKGISLNSGSDEPDDRDPKRVILNLVWRVGQKEAVKFSVRIFFGVPVTLYQGSHLSMSAHLLFGLSEPAILNLGVEETTILLSGAENSDNPKLKLTRILKFLLKSGDYLALEREETTEKNPFLSKETLYLMQIILEKYRAHEEAFVNLNFQFRLLELLKLVQSQTELHCLSPMMFLSTIKRQATPETTQKLLSFLINPKNSKDKLESLLNVLLQYYEGKETNSNEKQPKLFKKIMETIR